MFRNERTTLNLHSQKEFLIQCLTRRVYNVRSPSWKKKFESARPANSTIVCNFKRAEGPGEANRTGQLVWRAYLLVPRPRRTSLTHFLNEECDQSMIREFAKICSDLSTHFRSNKMQLWKSKNKFQTETLFEEKMSDSETAKCDFTSWRGSGPTGKEPAQADALCPWLSTPSL